MRIRAQIDGGRLTQILAFQNEASELAHLAAHAGARLIATASMGSPRSHWYDPAADCVRERQAMALQVAGTTITGLPLGAVVKIDGIAYPPVVDGVADLAFNRPGTYRVVIAATGYRDVMMDIKSP